MKQFFTLTVSILLNMIVWAQNPSWQQFAASPTGTDRHDDIFFIDANTGWAVRSNGYIHKTTDGGATWTVKANQPATHFRCIGFSSSTRGWAGNLGSGSFSAATDTLPLYETFDGGDTWTPVPGLAEQGVEGTCAIQVLDAQHIYAGGRVRGPAHFMKSEDGGTTWTVLDLTALGLMNGIMDVYFKDPMNGFIIGMDNAPYVAGCAGTTPYHGRIIKTTDGGATWSVVLTTTISCAYFWKIVFPSPNVGYVSLQQNGTYNNIIYYKTTDGGNNWTQNNIPLSLVGGANFFVQGIGFANDNTGWISGAANSSPYTYNMLQTTNGGTTWTPMGYDDSRRINKYRFLSPTLGFAAGTRLHKYAIPSATIGDDPCNAPILATNGVAVAGSITATLTQTNFAAIPAPIQFSNTSSTTAQIWNPTNVCEDFWYKAVIPASRGFRVNFTSTAGSSDLAMAIYSGSCSGLNPIGFTQIGADDGATLPKMSIDCRTPGETVYIRVWRYGCTGTGTIAGYTITLTELNNSFIGDEPSNAIVLNPNNPYLNGTLTTSYNDSKGVGLPSSCVNAVTTNGGYTFARGCEDIWYRFTATTTANITIDVNNAAGGSTDLSMALYTGNCGNYTQVACDGDNGVGSNPLITTNVTAGQTYFIRLWDYNCDFTTNITYSIRCYYAATTYPTPPIATGADNPCDANYLNMGITAGSILSTYTQTTGVPAPINFSNTSSTDAQIWNTANVCEDRWYRVIVPASGGFRLDFASTGGSSDLVVAVYSGSCSGTSPIGFAQIGADDGASVPKIAIGCRTPNETLFVRVWRFGCTGTGTIASYNLTMTDLYSTTIGDEPNNALGLNVNAPYFGATLAISHYETKGLAEPNNCGGGTSTIGGFNRTKGCEDIWFFADLPSSDIYVFEIDNAAGGSTDLSMAVYSGSCGSLNQVMCDNDTGNGANPLVRQYFTGSQRVFIRVWENNCDFTTNVTFNIRLKREINAFDLPVCTTTTLPYGQTYVASVSNSAQTNAATTFATIPDPNGCNEMVANSWTAETANSRQDSWFKIEVPASGCFRIDAISTGGSADPEIAVYATANGQCGIPATLIACDGDGGVGISATLHITGRTPGEIMYLRLWDQGTNNDLLCDLLLTATNCTSNSPKTDLLTTETDNSIQLLNLFPNPTNGWLNYSIVGQNTQNVWLLVSDLTGKTHYSEQKKLKEGTQEGIIDLSRLANGMYIFHIKTLQGESYSRKFSILK